MEYLKSFVITLCVTLLFVSAVEMILPSGSIKKYVKYVVGLILMAVILNPIVQILNKGEDVFVSSIDKYVKAFESGNLEIETKNINSNEIFIEKLEYSCIKVLKEKFKDLEFEIKIDANFDQKSAEINFNSIEVKYFKKGINKIAKVSIELDKSKTKEDEEDKVANEIKLFLMDELKVSKEKIKVARGS